MDTPDFHLSEFMCKCCGKGADIVRPELLQALQRVRDDWGKPMTIDCGYRCPAHNAAVGGAPDSAHLTGQAADILDENGSLKEWMNADMLALYGLWAEIYEKTVTWLHVQTRPAKARIFVP